MKHDTVPVWRGEGARLISREVTKKKPTLTSERRKTLIDLGRGCLRHSRKNRRGPSVLREDPRDDRGPTVRYRKRVPNRPGKGLWEGGDSTRDRHDPRRSRVRKELLVTICNHDEKVLGTSPTSIFEKSLETVEIWTVDVS